MTGRTTSYAALFASGSFDRVTIPMLQRDYAQGRTDAATASIRRDFLRAIAAAVQGGEPLGLDFVYGSVKDGALVPLDGQQRLTTLFLLHWYVAARARVEDHRHMLALSYETRASARRFCERLRSYVPNTTRKSIAEDVRDEPWFLSTWRNDPTIESMLVMIDDIHRVVGGGLTDDSAADCWRRLVDPARPAIYFHVLPIEAFGLGDQLYIRMNSRGRPLTEFEHFKAQVEQLLRRLGTSQPDGRASQAESLADEFSHKADTDWSDMLWTHKGEDDLIDDEFMRYLAFVVDLIAWRAGEAPPAGDDPDRTESVLVGAPGAPRSDAADRVAFLIDALDCWVGVESRAWFDSFLSIGPQSGRVALYSTDASAHTDLFATCLREYSAGKASQGFPLPRVLLLAGAVLHRMGKTPDFPGRFRVLRNLIEASGSDEIRATEMPKLIADVRTVIEGGTDRFDVHTLNQRQVGEERRKVAFVTEYPSLRASLEALEDHPLLRGCIGSMVLDPDTFERRATTFPAVLAHPAAAAGALLGCGDYGQRYRNGRFVRFGAQNTGAWREILRLAGRPIDDSVVVAMAKLLDRYSELGGEPLERLQEIVDEALQGYEARGHFDWRYYLLKWSSMREPQHGIYATVGGAMGFQICMLGGQDMRASHRDPYLLAVYLVAGVNASRVVGKWPWFQQYEWQERWLELKNGAAIRCVPGGFTVRIPDGTSRSAAIEATCRRHGVTDGLLAVAQEAAGVETFDTVDRIELGAALLRELAAI